MASTQATAVSQQRSTAPRPPQPAVQSRSEAATRAELTVEKSKASAQHLALEKFPLNGTVGQEDDESVTTASAGSRARGGQPAANRPDHATRMKEFLEQLDKI